MTFNSIYIVLHFRGTLIKLFKMDKQQEERHKKVEHYLKRYGEIKKSANTKIAGTLKSHPNLLSLLYSANRGESQMILWTRVYEAPKGRKLTTEVILDLKNCEDKIYNRLIWAILFYDDPDKNKSFTKEFSTIDFFPHDNPKLVFEFLGFMKMFTYLEPITAIYLERVARKKISII